MSTRITFDYSSVINAIPNAVIVVDGNKKIVGMNIFARRLQRSNTLIGMDCSEVFPFCEKRGKGCPIEGLDYRIPREITKLRQKINIGNGLEDVRCRLIPAEMQGDEAGRVFLHIIMDKDLLAREKMLESEKNLTLTTLASGIAHEFNNMNAGIYATAELVMGRSDVSADVSRGMNSIINTVKRATGLIDQLQIFSNRKPSRRVLVNLETIVDDSVRILRPELAAQGVYLEIVRRSAVEDIFVDASKVGLAIMNIIMNARDAVIGRKEKIIHIETGGEGGSCYVKIQDAGAGIPPELIDRIFEPFYTTKGPLGHSVIPGTGLGLSVAAGVIREHNGTIEVESEYGRGTAFIIRLPQNAVEEMEKEISLNYHEYDFTGKRILVADAGVMFNRLLSRALESKHAEVHPEYSGSGALAAVEGNHTDLLIIDMHMPDINGLDVVNAIKFRKERPRIMLVSGSPIVMEPEDTKYVDRVLSKPFSLHELYGDVREVLGVELRR